MSEYKTQDLRRLFDVTGETIRKWTEAFADYLSPTATPGPGRHRIFTIEDIEVLALVSEFKEMGRTYEDARLALSTGQRGDVPENLDVQLLEASLQIDKSSQQIIELSEHVQELLSENIKLNTLLQKSLEDVSHLRSEAQNARQEARQEAQQARQEAREQVESVQDKIAKLEREIGRLSALLEVERGKSDEH